MITTLHRLVLAGAATALTLAGAATPALGAQFITDWSKLPAKVTAAQTVWEPTYTAGQSLHSTTAINAKKCTGQAGYLVTALYSNSTAVKTSPELNVIEQPAASCADKGYTWYGPVGTVTIPHATVTILGQCGWDAAANKPVDNLAANFTCPKSSVKATGGLLILKQTSKTNAKQMGSATIETTGLTYAQLVKVAKGLKPVA